MEEVVIYFLKKVAYYFLDLDRRLDLDRWRLLDLLLLRRRLLRLLFRRLPPVVGLGVLDGVGVSGVVVTATAVVVPGAALVDDEVTWFNIPLIASNEGIPCPPRCLLFVLPPFLNIFIYILFQYFCINHDKKYE